MKPRDLFNATQTPAQRAALANATHSAALAAELRAQRRAAGRTTQTQGARYGRA